MIAKTIGMLAAAVCCAAFSTEAFATQWQVSLWGQRRAFTEHVEMLAQRVARDTNGAFKIEISYGGLSPSRENLDGIAAGKFEMAQFCAGYHREKNQLITVLELPFLGVATLEEELAVSEAVYAHSAVAEEMAHWNARLLMPTPLPQYNLVGSAVSPTGLDWFEGARIRATGGIGKAFARLGAEPLSLSATETYAALEAADLDAVAFAQHAHFSFDTISLAKWWTSNLDPGSVNCPVVVSIDAYDSLPSEHRAALDAAIAPAMGQYLENYRDLINKWDEILALFDLEKVAFSPEEIASFKAKVAAPVREAWIKEMTAQGFPASEVFSLVERTLAEVRAGSRSPPPSDAGQAIDLYD